MSGVIRADGKTRRCECGGNYVRRKRRDFVNEVPVCETCGDTPALYTIRVTLPGMPKKDIRYTPDGERLTTASQADQTLERIRKSIADRTFDPMAYLSKGHRQEFLFKNFADYYVETRRRDLSRPLSPGGEAEITGALRLYLNPYFGATFVPEITETQIQRYIVGWQPVGGSRIAKGTRQRDKSIEVLRAVLGFAKRLGVIKVVPEIPRVEKTRKHRARVPLEVQQTVIERIPDPYRAAIETMRLFLARESEIAALRWRDIDFDTRTLHIRRHYSKGRVELEGRKSISDPHHPFFDHQHRFGDEFFEILRRLPRHLDPDALVFPGRNGKPMGPSTLYKNWKRALAAHNQAHRTDYAIDLYRGVKSSTGQALIASGLSKDQVRITMGQTSTTATDHYVTESATHVAGVVEGVLVKMRTRKTAEKGLKSE